MLYYLAMTWNDADPEKRDTARALQDKFLSNASPWRTAIEQEGLAVYYHAPVDRHIEAPYILHRQRGVILGRLFDKAYTDRDDTHESPPANVVLDERRSTSIIASAGKVLAEHYWGQYVAFLHDPRSRTRWVLRDPTGNVPCEWIRLRGIDTYFVRLEDCERLGLPPLSIDRHYLLGYLVFGSLFTRHTGISEIQTVLPGERITHELDKRTHDFFWNPLEIADQQVTEDIPEAARLLRRTVRTCVHAWASCFDNILLQLSGGLDSSIVASCLADAPTHSRIICRNRYSSEPSLDERRYARLVARRFGFELIETPCNNHYTFEPIETLRRALFPYPWWLDDRNAGEKQHAMLRAKGVEAEFSGQAGDELFLTSTSFPCAADYAWRHGISPKLLSIALDDATAHKVSIWKVLKVVYRHGLRKIPWHMRKLVPVNKKSLLLPEPINDALTDTELWHPLFVETAHMPRAKFVHAHSLIFGTNYGYAPSALDNPLVGLDVLRSQPLLELSLRIPVYVLKFGGKNRALARRAFSSDLPREVILRDTKALGAAQLKNIFFDHGDFAKELLLDGFLVREGFLNKAELETVLSGQISRLHSEILDLCAYMDIEAWVRSWNGNLQRAAA